MRVTVILLAATLLLSLSWSVPARAAPDAAAYQFTDPSQPISFEGKGWGHGLGLCQWGARGRAQAGQSAEQIVGAYYAGTSIQQAISPDLSIRVLVHADLRLNPGETPRITAQGGAWQLLTTNGATANGPQDGYLALSVAADGPRYAVKAPNGAILSEGSLSGPVVLR